MPRKIKSKERRENPGTGTFRFKCLYERPQRGAHTMASKPAQALGYPLFAIRFTSCSAMSAALVISSLSSLSDATSYSLLAPRKNYLRTPKIWFQNRSTIACLIHNYMIVTSSWCWHCYVCLWYACLCIDFQTREQWPSSPRTIGYEPKKTNHSHLVSQTVSNLERRGLSSILLRCF